MRPKGMRLAALFLLLGAAGGLTAVHGAAQEGPPPAGQPRDFRLPEKAELTLENGLEATLVAYGAVPKVAVRLVIRTGNIDEAADEVWLADLAGDLLEEGTTTRSARQIAEQAASMGGSLGVGVEMDQTTISGEVLSEFGPDLVRLIADVIRHPAFPASELERLKADRLRELAIARTQPDAITSERFRLVMYPDHPYGRLFPAEELLRGYSLEQIRAFYARHFGAARAHVYVSGRFDERAMRKVIREVFADWEAGRPPTVNIPSPVTARALYVIDRPGSVQSTIYLGLPAIDPSHADWVALDVADALLGGAFTSRITQNIREDKGYTYSPFSTVSARYRDAYWVQMADVTTDVTGAALGEILKEIETLRNEAPPADELRRIQNYMAGLFVLQNSSRSGIIGQLAFLDLHGLPEAFLTSYVQRVYEVTPGDVQRVAKEYLRPEDMLLVVTGDRARIESQLGAFATAVFTEQEE